MAETATAVAEAVDFRAQDESEWGKMTPEQQEADVEKAVSVVAERRGIEAPPEKKSEKKSEKKTEKKVAAEKPPAKEPPKKEPEKEPEIKETKETKETTAVGEETPTDDDAAAPEKEGDDEGEPEKEEEAEWLDDSVRDYAGAMGLTEDDLSLFGSREELDRALRIIDRKAYEAGKAAQKPPVEVPKPVEKPIERQDDPFADLAKYKLGDQFDEEAAKPINEFVEKTVATIKQLQDRLARFEQAEQRQAVESMRRQATDSLLSLGHAELFGNPGEKPTKEQKANIEKAIEAHVIHASGLIAQGRNVAPTPEFLKAAVHLAFGDQLTKLEQKRITEKLRKQSARRTGGSAAKPLPKEPPENETQRERAQRIAADPDVQAVWNKLTAERSG